MLQKQQGRSKSQNHLTFMYLKGTWNRKASKLVKPINDKKCKGDRDRDEWKLKTVSRMSAPKLPLWLFAKYAFVAINAAGLLQLPNVELALKALSMG